MTLCAGAAALLIRLSRWRGAATWREPFLLILHIGYFFVLLGFLTVAVSILLPHWLPLSAALHAWTAGAIGVMTIGVMTRVALGHTGRPLTASSATETLMDLYRSRVGCRGRTDDRALGCSQQF